MWFLPHFQTFPTLHACLLMHALRAKYDTKIFIELQRQLLASYRVRGIVVWIDVNTPKVCSALELMQEL